VADSYQWPVNDSGREPRAIAPVRVDAEGDDAWFPSEDDEQLVPASRDIAKKGRDRIAPDTRDASIAQGAAASRPGRSWRRWALPALALVVVVETGWLVADRVLESSPLPTAVVPSATPSAAADAVDTAPQAAGAAADTRADVLPASGSATAPQSPIGAGVAPAVAAPGRVTIPLPFQVQVYEGTRFIGINEGSLALTPGPHVLELVNDSLGFRSSERVFISSGATTRLAASVPTVRMQLNAVPWADVTIDGASVGETPLGNVPVSIGPHTIVFRHPQLGEQSRTVVVTAQTPARISVDLRK
jgi:hypothetical protein